MHAHSHSTFAHTPGAILSWFPEAVQSAWPCQTSFSEPRSSSATAVPKTSRCHHNLAAKKITATFKAQDKNLGGQQGGGWSSQPAWDGSHFKEAELHRRSVPRRTRGVWKAEMAAVWAHAKATSGRNVRKIWFFFFFLFSHCLRGEVERKQSRIRQKLKKLGGCIKSEERWTAEQRMANYFSPLVSPEGFPGSEVQPSWSAEDCIKLNLQSCFTQ